MMDYDYSLKEVWRWKEEVRMDLEGLDTKGYIAKLKSDAEQLLKLANVTLPDFNKHYSSKRTA